MSAIVITKSNRNERGLDELRNGDWRTNGYQTLDEASFKKRLRVSRDTFQFILAETKDLTITTFFIIPYFTGAIVSRRIIRTHNQTNYRWKLAFCIWIID